MGLDVCRRRRRIQGPGQALQNVCVGNAAMPAAPADHHHGAPGTFDVINIFNMLHHRPLCQARTTGGGIIAGMPGGRTVQGFRSQAVHVPGSMVAAVGRDSGLLTGAACPAGGVAVAVAAAGGGKKEASATARRRRLEQA